MAEKRNRAYFLTIHQEADCYEKAFDLVKDEKTTCWAGIIHDQDKDEDGQVRVHKHMIIELENGKTLSAMRKKFKGAHIEIPVSIKGSYLYLLHRTEKAKNKHQYQPREIITDYPKKVDEYLLKKEVFEPFIEADWKRYIVQGTTNPWKFCTRFGLEAYKKYGKPYFDMVEFFRSQQLDEYEDQEMKDLANKESEGELPYEQD